MRLQHNARGGGFDARLRALERAAETGGQAEAASFNRELRRAGPEAQARYMAGVLAARFRGREQEPHGAWPDMPPEQTPGFGEVHPGHGAVVRFPDFWDRPNGLILQVEVSHHKSPWTIHTMHSLGAKEIKHRTEERGEELSYRVEFTAGISQQEPLFPPLHPFYFWRFGQMGNKYELLSRRFLDTAPGGPLPNLSADVAVLARDLDEEAFAWAIGNLLYSLQRQIGLSDTALAGVMRNPVMAGTLDPARAMEAVRGVAGQQLKYAVDILQAVPGPALEDGTACWNMSGNGVLHGHMVALGRWLVADQNAYLPESRHGRRVSGRGSNYRPGSLHTESYGTGDPYCTESGYFASSSLNLTTSRARTTNSPLRINCWWDRVNGAWRDRGNGWIGNTELARHGKWWIVANGPLTVQDLGEEAVRWIKAHCPESEILISNNRFVHMYNDDDFTRVWPR